VALVTGAGRGIGREIAIHFAEEGAAVVLNDRDAIAGASEAAERIRACGGRAAVCQADVSEPVQAKRLIEAAVAEFGRLDILVNNAGIDPRRPALDVTEDFWDDVLGVNLKGSFFCAQSAAREMCRTGGGRIINISSVHSQANMPDLSAYAASKGGLNALTRQLALELAPGRITVNAVAPGCILVEKCTFDPTERGSEIPLGRVGQPRDISALVVFLASDDAAWLTGQVITVDGGTMTRLSLSTASPALRC
jgi:NAD(P)-dependent dehydrogenase (short-subunit alcohol dehydrogenase family)